MSTTPTTVDLPAILAARETAESAYFAAAHHRMVATKRWVAASILATYPTAATLKAYGSWVSMDDFALRSQRILAADGTVVLDIGQITSESAESLFLDEIDQRLDIIADLGGPEERQDEQTITLADWLVLPGGTDLVSAARTLLHCLENITTEQFAHGGEQVERQALRRALDLDEDEPAVTSGPLIDRLALDLLNLLLSAAEWPGASGMEDVCEIVRATGRTEVAGAPEWRSH